MKKEKLYRRLPGKKRSSFRTSTLWAGPDHLLLVETAAGFSESYRRFYYKDIQGIITHKTYTALIIQIIIGLLTLLSAYFTYVLARDNMVPGAGFLGVNCFVLFAYLLGSLINGTSCECWIITAVGREKLTSVNYLRPARKMLAIVKPLIENVQGRLNMEALAPGTAPNPSVNPGRVSPQTMDPVHHEKGIWHKFLFIGLVLTSCMDIILLFHRPVFLIVFSMILFFATSMLAIISVVRQIRSQMTSALKFWTWSAMGYVIVGYLESYGEVFYYLFIRSKESRAQFTELELVKFYSQMNPFDHPMILRIDIALIIVACIVGFGGLGLLRRES